jgi:hypothetical protein
MRKFYLLYADSEKSQSLIRISERNNAMLSWTHYLVLIRIENNGANTKLFCRIKKHLLKF